MTGPFVILGLNWFDGSPWDVTEYVCFDGRRGISTDGLVLTFRWGVRWVMLNREMLQSLQISTGANLSTNTFLIVGGGQIKKKTLICVGTVPP